jgi:hypothetical protein
MPLVIVTVPAEIEHPPTVATVTGSVELAVAATWKVEWYRALEGACVPMVMV